MATVADLLVKIGADAAQLLNALAASEVALGKFVTSTEVASEATAKLALGAAAVGVAIVGAYGAAAVASGELQKLQM